MTARCCHLTCALDATHVVQGHDPSKPRWDDYTHACASHLDELAVDFVGPTVSTLDEWDAAHEAWRRDQEAAYAAMVATNVKEWSEC